MKRKRSVFQDRFVRATYLTLAEKAYGAEGVRVARRLLDDLDRDGEQALDRHCAREGGTGKPRSRRRSAFADAARQLGLVDADDAVPCHVRCGVAHRDCQAGCAAMPDWQTRLLCELACGAKFLACLARC